MSEPQVITRAGGQGEARVAINPWRTHYLARLIAADLRRIKALMRQSGHLGVLMAVLPLSARREKGLLAGAFVVPAQRACGRKSSHWSASETGCVAMKES